MSALFVFQPSRIRNSPLNPDKSIAVLPFENRSEDKANAYFADGIQDEILTRLSNIADLKVISRTSTRQYQSKPANLRESRSSLVWRTFLRVACKKLPIRFGSMFSWLTRKPIPISGQTYDRKLTDIFGSRARSPEESPSRCKRNSPDARNKCWQLNRQTMPEAYDLFLRGQYEFHQAENSLAADVYDRVDAFYRQALARDPNFAEAAAELARSRLSRHWFVSPLAPAELEEVRSHIDRALALAPNSPEAHFALGLFFYWVHRQYENALTEFNRTLELQPNNADTRAFCAWVYRRRGEWERSLADSQRAEELDPRDASIPTNIGATCFALRLWKDAERAELRALAIDPHNTQAAMFLVLIRLTTTGDVDLARRALDDFPEVIKGIPGGPRGATGPGDVGAVIGWPVYLDLIERRFTDAFQAVEKRVVDDDRAHLQQLAGRVAIRVLAGEPEVAKSMGEEALPLLEARFRERPDDTFAMTELSWVYLALGRNADALRLSRQAADTISIEKDALAGPNFQMGLAQIEARAGAPEEAIKRLRHLLSIPAGGASSIVGLKIDPVWDPIRNRPDFQQLLSGPEQIGPNK